MDLLSARQKLGPRPRIWPTWILPDIRPRTRLKTTATTSVLDREARLLAENALRFNLASNLMKTQLKLVSSAIQEGKTG